MIVVPDGAVIAALNIEFFDDFAKQKNELSVIGIVKEDLHAAVSAGHGMSNQTRRLNPSRTWHASTRFTKLAGAASPGKAASSSLAELKVRNCCTVAEQTMRRKLTSRQTPRRLTLV